jgi:hypothetical protein
MSRTNKVLRFEYDGGSTPGSTRLVFVTEDDGHLFRGWDFDREAFRAFAVRNVRGEAEVPAEIINALNLPNKVNDQQLIADYLDDGYLVYDNEGDTIVFVQDNRVEVVQEPHESIVLQYSTPSGSMSISIDDNDPATITTFDANGNQLKQETRNLGSAGMVLAKVLT